MGARRGAAAGLLYLLWPLVSSKNAQPSCHTDYATELICRWEVVATTNCTTEFKFLYRASFAKQSRECVLENEEGPGVASHCMCFIPGLKYRGVMYDLVLSRRENRAEVWNVTLDVDSIVKPRPLINLTVVKRKDYRFILTWKRDYKPTNSLYQAVAQYEVAYWPKNHMELKTILLEDSSHHEIFADKLYPGSTYEASVRYKLIIWGETWSEWSPTCEWLNDFEPHPGKESRTFIPWLCIMAIALILFCYLCFLWVKRKWWDGIPSPAKSKMVEDLTVRKEFPGFGKMETAGGYKTNPCDSCRRQFQSKDGADLPHQPTSVNWELFLIPEVSLIEGSLTTCSSAVDFKLGGLEEEEMDHVSQDDALAGLFRDLLHGVLSTGDPAPPATSAQSRTAVWGRDGLKGFSQPLYPDGKTALVASEGSGPVLHLGQGPSFPEVQVKCLPTLESSPAAASSTVIPGRASPWAEDQTKSTAAPSAPGYKSFSSLEAQAGSSFSQAWEQWPCLSQGGQTQAQGSTGSCLLPPGTESPFTTSGMFPADQDSLSLYGPATEMWLLHPRQGMTLDASAQQGSGRPGSLSGPKASLSSGYRSFSCDLQNSISSQDFCLKLESPYKPFLSLVPLDPSLEVA